MKSTIAQRSERRSQPRVTLNVGVSFVDPSNIRFEETNLSEGGILIYCEDPPEVGTTVCVTLVFEPGQDPIVLTGRVAHVNKGDRERCVMGVQWLSVPSRERSRLHEAVTSARRGPRLILLVDDDLSFCSVIGNLLTTSGYETISASSWPEALGILRTQPVDAMVLDYILPDGESTAHLRELRILNPMLPVVLVSAHVELERLTAEGAPHDVFDILTKPFDFSRLLAILERLGEDRVTDRSFGDEHGESTLHRPPRYSDKMNQLWYQCRLFAELDSTICIGGETGVGKTLIACWLHQLGPRHKGPFVTLECGSVESNLLGSEIFGHERGAFTGAHKRHIGALERSNGGTLFLDEISQLDLRSQSKLLAFLDSGTFRRLGGNETLRSNARIVTATNANLQEMVRQNRFREDLWFRIEVLRLEVPPLRERHDDLVALAYDLLREMCEEHRRGVPVLRASAIKMLKTYPWPGNVRELRNVLERTLVATPGDRLTSLSLPESGEVAALSAVPAPVPETAADDPGSDLPEELRVQKQQIKDALLAAGGNVSQAARDLSLSRWALYRIMRRFGIKQPPKS